MKIERNNLCPCGSGLKYKKCCLLKENEQEAKETQEWNEWFQKDVELGQKLMKEANCTHNTMVENNDPNHAWKCAECGYVYG